MHRVGKGRGGGRGEGAAGRWIERIVDDVVAVPIDLNGSSVTDGDSEGRGIVVGEIVRVVDTGVAGGQEVDADGRGTDLAEIEHDGDGAGDLVDRGEVGASVLIEVGSDDAIGSGIHGRMLPLRRVHEAGPIGTPKNDGFGTASIEGGDDVLVLVAVEIRDRHAVRRLVHREVVSVAEAVPLPEEQVEGVVPVTAGEEADDAFAAVVVEEAWNDELGGAAHGDVLAAAEAHEEAALLLRIEDGGAAAVRIGSDEVEPGVAVGLERRHADGSGSHVIGPVEHEAFPAGRPVCQVHFEVAALGVGEGDIDVLVAVEVGADDADRAVPARGHSTRVTKAYEMVPLVLAQQNGDVVAAPVSDGDVEPGVLVEIGDGDPQGVRPDVEVGGGLVTVEFSVVVDGQEQADGAIVVVGGDDVDEGVLVEIAVGKVTGVRADVEINPVPDERRDGKEDARLKRIEDESRGTASRRADTLPRWSLPT